MTEAGLVDILNVSRNNNQKNSLTGMLLYGEGTFIQVLEGEEQVLDKTYEVVKADDRHKNIIKVAEGNIEKRNFPDWSMGFKSANKQELAELGGFTDPKLLNNAGSDEANALLNMMKTFADANRMSDNY